MGYDGDDDEWTAVGRQLLASPKKQRKEISASSEELFALVSLTDVQAAFVDACWAQYKRQGLGGHEMLSAVLAEVGRAIDERDGSRLIWLKENLIDRCIHVVDDPLGLGALPTDVVHGDTQHEKLKAEYARIESEIARASADLTFAMDQLDKKKAEEQAKITEWRISHDASLVTEREVDNLVNNIKSLSEELEWHHRALENVVVPISPEVQKEAAPALGAARSSASAGTPSAGVARMAQLKTKVDTIKQALGLANELSMPEAISQAQAYLGIEIDANKRPMEKVDEILKEAERL